MGKTNKMEKVLKYRCFARPERKTGLYYSACIDLNISGSGKTLKEAVDTLNELIDDHVDYIVKAKRYEEIYRPAPARVKLDFYIVSFLHHLGILWHKLSETYFDFEPARTINIPKEAASHI